MIERAKQVFAVEIEGLEKTRDSLGASFVKAVRLILDTVSDGGIVVVSGVGKNLHVAEKMSAIFSSTGTRSIVLNLDRPQSRAGDARRPRHGLREGRPYRA